MQIGRLLITGLCFALGAGTAMLVVHTFPTKAGVYAETFLHVGGDEISVAGTVLSLDDTTITVQPIFYNETSKMPAARFAIDETTIFSEVSRRVQHDTVIESIHKDYTEDERANVDVGDVVYVNYDRDKPGKLQATYIKKVIIKEYE